MERTGFLKIAQRIIVIYTTVYGIVKLVAILKGNWLYPNLILMVGLLLIGGIGGYLIKKDNYNWFYTIIGIVLISALRYYEVQLTLYLHETLG